MEKDLLCLFSVTALRIGDSTELHLSLFVSVTLMLAASFNTSYFDKRFFFLTYIPCNLIIIKVFSPTDAQLDSLKNNIKFALKLILKSSYMFRCETPSSGNIPSEPC